ncbi:hypothetical protein BS47DRAFT_1368674 [Hydnum rufescens UP504]|uniref:Uncharacterized protein n=1 Tax=Hydnum rufescens UP504 TaxID=1448309 RepID=A0A9P6AG44_9AGAM|nr:hypothetical protein BS47DRAFT_1368674 [Hydnum rufescens UP504]
MSSELVGLVVVWGLADVAQSLPTRLGDCLGRNLVWGPFASDFYMMGFFAEKEGAEMGMESVYSRIKLRCKEVLAKGDLLGPAGPFMNFLQDVPHLSCDRRFLCVLDLRVADMKDNLGDGKTVVGSPVLDCTAGLGAIRGYNF